MNDWERALDAADKRLRQAGMVAVLGTLTSLLWGMWRGTRRPPGHSSGREIQALRTPAFYTLATVGFSGCCYALWRPLPLVLSRPLRALALLLGSLLYFPGLVLVLWGRLTLAQMYNASSTFGAQLYADQQLLTHGPFARVRHPMYLGILLATIGGILLYRTWTFLVLLLQLPVLVVRARWEEQALAAEFGAQWVAYRRRVPAWVPRSPRHAQEGEGR